MSEGPSDGNEAPRVVLPPIAYPKRKRKGLFLKDIENMLYAMGDTPFSLESTINAVEDILVEYIATLSTQMVHRAASQGRRNRIKLNDLAFVLRNDPLKLSRMLYFLEQSRKIEKAKKMFDDGTQDPAKKAKSGLNNNDDSNDDDNDSNDDSNDEDNKEGPDGKDDDENDAAAAAAAADNAAEDQLGEPVLDAEGNIIRRKRKYKKRAVELDENGNPIKKKYKKRKPPGTDKKE
ncbi:uncharacterized protein LODBEIA_P61090 [Lodderomyces beijingensis]|uniref:Transcription initiation factor TFIID subunit 13 n=1 Tax=Lodderomyces beijingensis TaxID=1775926 RepID=A0ABP0ZW57_9ASCO